MFHLRDRLRGAEAVLLDATEYLAKTGEEVADVAHSQVHEALNTIRRMAEHAEQTVTGHAPDAKE